MEIEPLIQEHGVTRRWVVQELAETRPDHAVVLEHPSRVDGYVPAEVPMWALKEVCLLKGHAADIDAALARLPQPQQAVVRNRWENKDTISRSSGHITALRQLLGWTDHYVDELFSAAGAL